MGTVIVNALGDVAQFGLTVTPGGRPVHVTVTGPKKPPDGVTVTGTITVAPAAIVCAVPGTVTVKLPPDATLMTTPADRAEAA